MREVSDETLKVISDFRFAIGFGMAKPLHYASVHSRRPPSVVLWRIGLGCAGVAAGVGVVTLLGYVLTRKIAFANFGLLWLLLGGGLTLASLLIGITFAAMARSAGYDAPGTRRRARAGILLPLANVLVSAGCTVLGLIAVNRPVAMVIINTGVTPVSSIVVHTQSHRYELGELAPGESIRRSIDFHSDSEVLMTYEVGGIGATSTLTGYSPGNATIADRYSRIEIKGPIATMK